MTPLEIGADTMHKTRRHRTWQQTRNRKIVERFLALRHGPSKRKAAHAVSIIEDSPKISGGLCAASIRRIIHAANAWVPALVLMLAVSARANTFYIQAAGCAVAPHDTAGVLVEAGVDSGTCTFVKGTIEYDARQVRIVGVDQLEAGGLTWSTLAPVFCGDNASVVFMLDGAAFTGVRPVFMLWFAPTDAGCQSALRWSCGNPPGIALIEILAESPRGGAWNRADPNLRVRDAIVTTTPCAGVGVTPASFGLVKALYR